MNRLKSDRSSLNLDSLLYSYRIEKPANKDYFMAWREKTVKRGVEKRGAENDDLPRLTIKQSENMNTNVMQQETRSRVSCIAS